MTTTIAGDDGLWLRLTLTPGLGPGAQRRLLAAFGSPGAVLEASSAAVAAVGGVAVARALAAGPDQRVLEASLAWLTAPGRFLLTWADEDYPTPLLHIADPPPVLFGEGCRGLLGRSAFAVVGSRNASRQGQEDALVFSRALSAAGLCIVSGLALGVDAAAHQGGLSEPGRSIAILGNGPDTVYPAVHARLARKMADEGLLLTEHAPGVPPLARHFPRRNRLISGLSRGVLVVEAAARSGSLVTARLALEQGRDVFAIPGSIHSPLAKGCHALIKEGAALVESADELLVALGLGRPVPSSSPRAETGEHDLILPLEHGPVSIETLVQRSGQNAGEVLARLGRLELLGAIERLAGGLYRRVRRVSGGAL